MNKYLKQKKQKTKKGHKDIWKNREHPRGMLGKKASEETKRKMSEEKKRWHKENKGNKMYEEKNKKISKKLMGRKLNYVVWNKGRHDLPKLTKEHKKKIGEKSRGRRATMEARRKMSKNRKGKNIGQIPWNKNLDKKEYFSHYKNGMGGLFKKGNTSWNKGRHDLPKQTEETKNKKRESRKGYKHSEETKMKIGKSNKGKKISKKQIEKMRERAKCNKYHLGHKHLEDTKKKIRKARAKQVLPIKDTSIEVKIQDFLKQLNIEFFTHQYIKEIEHSYQCDILIPIQNGINQKTIIECFGNYWHKFPMGREVDIQRCSELREKGWRVLTFWESEIKPMQLNNLQEKLLC